MDSLSANLPKKELAFAEIVWNNAPCAMKKIVDLCGIEFGWAVTTTYTVMKRLTTKGFFENKNGTINVLISKAQYEELTALGVVKGHFLGSLPSFVAAFTRKEQLTEKDKAEILRIINGE